MRLLVDPETGETTEVFPTQVVGPQEPYDYAAYRRANMAQTREHRAALDELAEAGKASARAESEYRRELARAVLLAKRDHGATVAEQIAKGEPAVVDAHEKRLAAESRERVAMEKVRLCRDDRLALRAMGDWSREADPDGWRGAGA